MRLAGCLCVLVSLALSAGGCVELGVVSDGTSISVGKPSQGRIVDGARMPDRGEGFVTRDQWKVRGNRYGTDELIDMLTAVSRRLAPKNGGIRLGIADLSGQGGGSSHQWHRSHQNGRDVDLLYYLKDRAGKPVENDAMHPVGPNLVTKDGSNLTVDIPKMWNVARELLTAPEATVQWVFVYQPVANAMIEHAIAIGEPEALIERARRAVKQPGDSAPHNDHMHVRVYCSPQDRAYGCVDIGPRELLAEREAEVPQQAQIASALSKPRPSQDLESPPEVPTPAVMTAAPAAPQSDMRSVQKLLRTGTYRVDLRRRR